GPPAHPQSLGTLEVDEEHADGGVDQNVAETLEHAVAIVARKGERPWLHDPDEPRPPSLVRAVRPPLGVRRGQKEHRPALDERAIAVRESRVRDDFDEPVGESPRLEP